VYRPPFPAQCRHWRPAAGNSFDLFDWASLAGTFDTLQLPELAGALTWNTSQLYTTGVVSVTAGLLGDFNGNGNVDAADYTVWRNGLGSIYSQADYDVWKSHFGESAGGGSYTVGSAHSQLGVPEPMSLALLAIGAIMGAAHRRNSRRSRRFV